MSGDNYEVHNSLSFSFREDSEGTKSPHNYSEEELHPPEKIHPNWKSPVHLHKFFWAISVGFLPHVTCHREEGKSSREPFEKVRVNAVFFGISGFWVGLGALKLWKLILRGLYFHNFVSQGICIVRPSALCFCCVPWGENKKNERWSSRSSFGGKSLDIHTLLISSRQGDARLLLLALSLSLSLSLSLFLFFSLSLSFWRSGRNIPERVCDTIRTFPAKCGNPLAWKPAVCLLNFLHISTSLFFVVFSLSLSLSFSFVFFSLSLSLFLSLSPSLSLRLSSSPSILLSFSDSILFFFSPSLPSLLLSISLSLSISLPPSPPLSICISIYLFSYPSTYRSNLIAPKSLISEKEVSLKGVIFSTRMLPICCPPMIWAILPEFCG